MDFEFDDPVAQIVTKEMLAAKIDELKSSADRLEGRELRRAYRLISSLSKEPYQFNINGPFQIFPDRTDVDRTFLIVGPGPVLPPIGPTPGGTTEGTIDCPNCGYRLKIKLAL